MGMERSTQRAKLPARFVKVAPVSAHATARGSLQSFGVGVRVRYLADTQVKCRFLALSLRRRRVGPTNLDHAAANTLG
jgi:hypothetical protein